MRMRKKAAILMAAALSVSAMSGVYAMAGSAISIDMTGCNDEAWANIAMVNDDTVQTGVNIRSAQSENASVAGYLYRGGAVRVLYKDSEWTEISSGDITGYVKNEYLVYGPEAKGLAEHYGTYGVKASWNDVNVFSGMSGDSRIVDTAGDGDTFKLVNKDGDWMTVQAGSGSVAYVPSEEVSVVMVLGGAVSVDGTREEAVSGAVESFRDLAPVVETAGSLPSEETVESYESSSDAASGSDGAGAADDGYAGTYEDTSYGDESYTDDSYTEPSYTEESYTDTGYTETYEEPAYEEPAPTYTEPEPVTYTTTVNTSGSYDELAAQASSLYQEYLTAQAAADAAVANGSGEQAIKETADAAVAAYGRYVTAQNAADAAQWGYTADTSSSQTGSSQSGSDTSASETTYTEETTSSSETSSSSDTSSSGGNTASASGSELELLAALIYCEAGNQPYEGQVAVGAVVMNRVASGSFPGSITDVIYQGGQFTPAYSGALASALSSGAGAGYIGAASDALAGSDPTGGCLYFNNHRGSGLKIGDHWFY